MNQHITTIRAFVSSVHFGEWTSHTNQEDALAALDALEAAMKTPVQLDHIACIDDGELRYMTGRKAPAYDCELYAMPDGKSAPPLFTAPPAQQYEAGDMASAHNDGFRAGVASVAQQPQAEAVPPGYVLVPVEQFNACKKAFDGYSQAPADYHRAVLKMKAAFGNLIDAAMAQGEKP